MDKCPNCKERPANFAFRESNNAKTFSNWCMECASTVANVFKLKEVLPPESGPVKDMKLMIPELVNSCNEAFERFLNRKRSK